MTKPIFLPKSTHRKFLMTPVHRRTASKGPLTATPPQCTQATQPAAVLETALRLHRAGPVQVHTPCPKVPSCHPKAVTYSIGNQSPQSCLTVSMSSWHSRRRFTSVSAVGGTSSVIHACKGRNHVRSDGTQALIQRHHEGLGMDKAAFPIN